MDHVAILNKQWKLLPKILSGEKSIESRWYKNRYSPWDKIKVGDKVFFKNSGEKVSVVTNITKVLQFDNLNKSKIRNLLLEYGKRICISSNENSPWFEGKRYCILMFLGEVRRLEKPFAIDKSGFGNACAWMCVNDINLVKK